MPDGADICRPAAPCMLTAADAIGLYIRAKDGNRPHLLQEAFASDATLQMMVRTDAISFPATSQGRDAIAETLVCRFNQTYENIYTFCLDTPPATGVESFTCDWLVAMSEKQGGAVRVGCGRYDWVFEQTSSQVKALRITIDVMKTLSPDTLAPVMDWVSSLPYPWCSAQWAAKAAPDIAELAHVLGRSPQVVDEHAH